MTKSTLRSSLAVGAALFAAAWSMTARAEDKPAAAPVAIGDYHMHIQGPAVTADLRRMKAAKPEIFAGMSDDMMNERSGADALAVLDKAGVRQGTLLSVAYMFASPLMQPAPADMAALTRTENAYNVAAGLASNGRLQAFISVNPLAANAMDELNYWRDRPGVSGLKLHLANSGFNPRADADIEKLAAVFAFAGRNALPIAIHVRNAKDYTADDARAFIDRVLPGMGDVPVQIAHGGSWGELDRITIDALALYGDAIAKQAKGTRNLRIELALLVVNDKTDPVLAGDYVKEMRRIGMDRFILGSDWPAIYTPDQYYALLRTQLPLTPEEWAVIFGNEAPYFTHPRVSPRKAR
ncbi:amidohydrolase family protein [Sphingomonas colocasiae]|uniref:Amidohydrolase n=1 Tax=Sphingomonas colocasiae TaxID=1848973 RepID=A0ABS7PVG4_9SPHN|nr:amidohydrolase family protein [Sphingomonas colocasiae]MBY8825261.1 amidohydrolase [Sphingomonas colocasiae]